MFAKSSDTRLRHNDWKWAADLERPGPLATRRIPGHSTLQPGELRDVDGVGDVHTWNGYDEGYAAVVGQDFHHNPNATPLPVYDRFYNWAQTVFAEAAQN